MQWNKCLYICFLAAGSNVLSAFGNSKANDLVTELLPQTVISCVVPTMRENCFLLFPSHLRLPYSIPKSFALLLDFHCFRDTFAMRLLDNGVDIYTIATLLGHKQVSSTQIYVQLSPHKARKALMKLK